MLYYKKTSITQDLLKIKFEDGQVRTVALFMETDITDVDYYEVLYPPKKGSNSSRITTFYFIF